MRLCGYLLFGQRMGGKSELSCPGMVADGIDSFYFTVANTSIYVRSSTPPTFSRLSTFCSNHPEGHKQPINALLLHPTNPFQLISGSEDGTAKVWDWTEGRLIRTIEMKGDQCYVKQMCVGEVLGKWWIFATVTHAQTKAGKTKIQKRKMDHRKGVGGQLPYPSAWCPAEDPCSRRIPSCGCPSTPVPGPSSFRYGQSFRSASCDLRVPSIDLSRCSRG